MNDRISRLSALIAFLGGCSSGAGETSRLPAPAEPVEIASSRAAIWQPGSNPPDVTHPQVVRIFATDGPAVCTATYITPNHLLTAAHCFSHDGPQSVSVGPFSNASTFKATVTLHPLAPPNLIGKALFTCQETPKPAHCPDGQFDMALVRLNERNLALAAAIRRPKLFSDDIVSPFNPAPAPGVSSCTLPARQVGWGLDNQQCPAGGGSGSTSTAFGADLLLEAGDATPTSQCDTSRLATRGWVSAFAYLDQPHGAHGDSGGPLFFVDALGTELQIGVFSNGGPSTQAGCEDLLSKHLPYVENFASTMYPQNAQWLDLALQQPSFPQLWLGESQPAGSWDDADQDGVGEFEDNCIDDFNPNQADSDGDGLGDACDNCPGVANVDQGNSNLDAELANYDPSGVEYASHLTAASTPQDLKSKQLHFQGDACEKVSQARAQDLSDQLRVCPTCGPSATWRSLIELDLTALPHDDTQSYGFRFCKCKSQDINSSLGRTNCNTTAQCPFQIVGTGGVNLFSAPSGSTPWNRITIDPGKVDTVSGMFTDPVQEPGTSALSFTWNFLQDPETWTSASGLTSPNTRGVLLAHVEPGAFAPSQNGLDDKGPDPAKPTTLRNRSNVFRNGSASVTGVTSAPAPPGAFVVLPGVSQFCPPDTCATGGKPPIFSFGPGGAAFAYAGAVGFDVSSVLAPEVVASIVGKGAFVAATEPRSILNVRGSSRWVGVHLRPDLSLDWAFLAGSGGLTRVDPRELGGPNPRRQSAALAPALPPGVAGGALIAEASSDRVIRVGGMVNGKPADDMWSLQVRTGEWARIPLLGKHRPGTVMAATHRFGDRATYVIDEGCGDDDGFVRVLRVRGNGAVERLASFPRIARAKVFLSTSDQDDLVLGLSFEHEHIIVVVGVDERGQLVPKQWISAKGRLETPVQASEHWLTAGTVHHKSRTVEAIPRSQMTPAFGFMGEGWW